MTHFARDLPFGATLVDPARTRFRLWAPAQTCVGVAIEGLAPIPMRAAGEGWFEAEVDCGPGTRYRYRLDDGTLVPDPASRAQAGDVHDPSVVVDPRAYRWRSPGWQGRPFEETVLYELHPGLLGGFAGIAERLPALAALGITAIELMPVAESPGARSWGYDGVLPFAPEAGYGSPEDLKALVDRAHELGLMVFLDVVYNHFGPDGNYLPLYAPPFFRTDQETPWGPAIDFRRQEVRRFFTENALYWLQEYRFDGLRLDAVHAISEPGWLDEMAAEVRAAVEPGRHVHLVLENADNIASHLAGDFDAQWNDDIHHVLHVLLTGETGGYYADYADAPAEKLARALSEGFVFQGEPSPHWQGRPRGTPSAHLPPTAFVAFLQNHDQIGNRAFGERLTVLADPRALRAAVALLMLSPQVPLIFMGEEMGAREPFLYFTSHGEELAKAVREGRRREFATFPEFADPVRRDAIPDPNDPGTFAASRPLDRQDRGGAGWLDLYRRLLALRGREIVPRLRGAQSAGAHAIGRAAVLARWRLGDGAVLTLAANLGAEAAEFSAAGGVSSGRLLFATEPGSGAGRTAGGLPPYTTLAWIEEGS